MNRVDDVRAAALAVLAEGPLPERELIDAIAARLGDRSPTARRAREHVTHMLRMLPDIVEVGDGLTLVELLVDGTSWAVHVDPDDAAGATGDGTTADGTPHGIEGGWLRVRDRLDPLSWWLIDDGAELVDQHGDRLGTLRTEGLWLDGVDTDVLWCGPGWLDEVAGGWATLTVRDGAISIAPLVAPPPVTDAQVAAIRAGFDTAVAGDGRDEAWDEPPPDRRFAGTGTVVQHAIWIDGDAFRERPIPPIPDLIEAAGLAIEGGLVVERGFDWEALRSWQRINRLTVSYGLDRDQARQAVAATGALHAALDADEVHDAVDLADLLPDGAVAVAALEDVFRSGHDVASVRDLLDGAATAIADRGEHPPAGLVWGQAMCATASGDTVAADRLVAATVAAGTEDPLVLVEAAEFAADRGDAAEAFRLLVRAGVEPYDEERDRFRRGPSPAEALLAEVAVFARPPRRSAVGRNDPCPCGSGRKYKVCHQRATGFTLAERAPWLYDKALRFAHGSLGEETDELARTIGGDVADAVAALQASPIVADMVLSLDDGWEEFVELRGPLLPDDEQLLATQWAMVRPSVYDVIDVEHRRGHDAVLGLRDIATGDRLGIESVDLGDRVRPGDVMFGRPLPVGDAFRAFSGLLPVSRSRANELIDAIAEADVYGVAEVLAAEFRPPRLQNSDGEDLELHEIEWSLGLDRPALAAALRELGVDADPAESTWSLLGETQQGPDTVIATLRVDDAHDALSLTAEVNSAGRAERVLAMIESIAPGVAPVRHEVTPIDEALAEARDRADDERSEPEPIPPGAAEAVAEMMARFEERWIDERIPALGGRTPREAVEDPVGREEVRQLLASFSGPGDDGIGAMDPARIRTLLGLD